MSLQGAGDFPTGPIYFMAGAPPKPKVKKCGYCGTPADPRTNICQLCLRVTEVKEPEPWRK